MCISSGLTAVLPLGGDRAALPADCGWVDRAWAPVRLCQGVHHPEVREVHQTLSLLPNISISFRWYWGGAVPIIELYCHHKQVLLHFYINRRHQVPATRKIFSKFYVNSQLSILANCIFWIIVCLWMAGMVKGTLSPLKWIVVQSLKSWPCPIDYRTPGFPVLHCLWDLAQIHVPWVCNAS